MRNLLAFGIILALAACGGGSTGTGIPATGGTCDPGTQVTLARPFSGQTAVSTGTSSIEIVANGNNNTLFQSFQSWDLLLVPQFGFGGQITTNNLTLTSDPSGPHPFPSDFYYTASFSGGLQAAQTYAVFLNANVNCSPVGPIGSFST